MQTRPILIYECYANGSSVDPSDSVNITVLLDGTDPATSVASVVFWSASKGTPNSYVKSNFQTRYDAARGVGVRTNSTATEDTTVLRYFKGQSLYVKLDIPSKNNTEGYKIYDVDFECTNAKILLREVCPFRCNMKLTREL
ncbi:secreted protein, putative [Ixodes scapularis]|uniref:Secreted protein, putative n=1 Tax=Ixodes scapularis TaxID=6945 RepID=B7P182_IXOSC|nr:secreted protein, putative [Ixodes scapularis]|eukprot:XP_002400593.1 secreted protein, putative [Ixodes scapularis]